MLPINVSTASSLSPPPVHHWLVVIALLVLAFGLGGLPLPRWIVRRMAKVDLQQLGTGNISVSATFKQVGTQVGVVVVLAEILRGIMPVLLAAWLLPNWPAVQIGVLISLVVARYAIAKGGGVTNATWGGTGVFTNDGFAICRNGFNPVVDWQMGDWRSGNRTQ